MKLLDFCRNLVYDSHMVSIQDKAYSTKFNHVSGVLAHFSTSSTVFEVVLCLAQLLLLAAISFSRVFLDS